MTCATCGADNRIGAKFCSECGHPLAATCPGCGAPTAPAAKFCAECGERLIDMPAGRHVGGVTAGAVPSSGAGGGSSGAERRLVTVLFADLVGFTSLAEGRDAETVRDLLSAYFDTASEIIGRYGGTVEKFIGDAVMAVWGAPTAHEDDAERAVRAALDLVVAIPAIGGDQLAGLQARAGVLTGEAAVTIGATNQGLVAGDLVNTASRLQTAAVPGTVLVGESTRAAASGAIAFEPSGETTLKGKALPVPAFRALRVVAKVRGLGRSEGLEPPFVGRDAEFRVVREAFHAVARDRRARLVSITGDAGVGKSRLAWEFSKYTDGLADRLFWHEGRSPAYGEGISFWALGEMARKRCDLLEADDDATTRERVVATLAEYVPDPAERPAIERCLLALLGLEDPPPGGRDGLFAGWRTFLERLAATDPVVLLFEDIQWADDGQLDFIESVLEWSQSYPIYVLTLSRPELLDRRPTWGAARNATSLPLGPLSDDAMYQLLDGLVPGLPETAVRTILERAGGMPLYAVETVRMLVSEGRLEAVGDGTHRAAGPLDAIDVPASLQALIAARLDALLPADRGLVQDASVLGQTFAVAALAAITGDDPEALEPRLRSLVSRDLLALDTDPRSPERGQYGFVQALIREVAYGTLSKRDRRTRHLAAARYFEALGDEELVGALATHYLAAYEAAAEGPEADALAGQARIALRAASGRARALGSLEQSISFLESAARLPGDETEQLSLLETAGDIALESSRYARSAQFYDEVARRALAVGDRSRSARVTAGRAEATFPVDADGSVALAEQAIADFADLDPEAPEVLWLHMFRARAAVRRGHNREAAEISERIAGPVERTRDEHLILVGLVVRGAALSAVGRPVEGMVILEGAFHRAAAGNDWTIANRARINLAVLTADDDIGVGREIAVAGFREAYARGMRADAAFFALNASEYDMHIGDFQASIERTQAVLALDLEGTDRILNLGTLDSARLLVGLPVDDPSSTGLESSNLTAEDDVAIWQALVDADGPELVRGGLALARDDELNAPTGYLRAAIGAAMAGDVESARAAADELARVGRWGRWVDAVGMGTEAIARAMEGSTEAAVALGREAAAAMRAQSSLLDDGLIMLGLGIALPAGVEADEALAHARQTFETIGAAGLVGLCDRGAEPRSETGERHRVEADVGSA